MHFFWIRIFSKPEKKNVRFQNYSDARVRGFKLTLTVNGKPQPREQVFPLIIVYYLLYLHKNRKFHVSFIHKKKICAGVTCYFPISQSNCQIECDDYCLP